jgi:hypothetical protein
LEYIDPFQVTDGDLHATGIQKRENTISRGKRTMEAVKLSIISNEEAQHVQQNDHLSFGALEQRLLTKYEKHGGEEKVKFILNVEVAAHEAEATGVTDFLFYGDGEMFKGIDHVIESRAKHFYKENKGYGIKLKEFKDAFVMEALRLVKTPLKEEKEHYTFYERLQQSCEKRAVDVIRKFTNDKEKQERKVRQGKVYDVSINKNKIVTGNGLTLVQKSVEEEATTNALITQMIDDDALTDEEQSLLLVILEDLEGNNSSWGRSLGVSYHKVQRTRNKIAVKLAAYKKELVS